MAVIDPTAHASAMGARAGEAFAQTGVPARNPFDDVDEPELAAAWRAAYLTAAKPQSV